MSTAKYVAYYRVSTASQGASGLGLEAQREAVARFLGAHSKPLAEFTEVETGKGRDALTTRPQLREAIATAKRAKATILIAKLDRLARNVHFIAGLQEAKVKFTAVDMPEANDLVIHLMAAMAQHEATMISARTKAALAAKKARGEKLGNPHLLQRGNLARSRKATAFAKAMRPTLKGLLQQGLSQRAIVGELNGLGVRTAQGGTWGLLQVQRVLTRVGL